MRSRIERKYGKSIASMIGATSIALTAAVFCQHAVAALSVSCPHNSRDLAGLHNRDLDAVVLGVKIRDWRPEYLDEYVAKASVCVQRSNQISSIKDAEMRDLIYRADMYRGEVAGIQARVQAESRRVQAESRNASVSNLMSQLGLKVVRLDHNGAPTVELPKRGSGSTTQTCESLKYQGLGSVLSEDGYHQLTRFANLCVQLGFLNQPAVEVLEHRKKAMLDLYGAAESFTFRVERLAGSAHTIDQVRELSDQLSAIRSQTQALRNVSESELDGGSGRYARALRAIKAWEVEACDRAYDRMGFPAPWKSAMLAGLGGFIEFPAVICRALVSGAQVRYLSGGLFGSEGFEVRSSNRIVKIYPELYKIPGGRPGVNSMVPVEAEVFGKKVDVDEANFADIMLELAAAANDR